MTTAPRDGRRVRLWLRDGGDFVGYYTGRWRGWIDYSDPHPLIRGDIRFLGWEPVDQDGQDDVLVQRAKPSGGPAAVTVVPPEMLVVPVVAQEPEKPAVAVKIIRRVVTARKPRLRRSGVAARRLTLDGDQEDATRPGQRPPKPWWKTLVEGRSYPPAKSLIRLGFVALASRRGFEPLLVP